MRTLGYVFGLLKPCQEPPTLHWRISGHKLGETTEQSYLVGAPSSVIPMKEEENSVSVKMDKKIKYFI